MARNNDMSEKYIYDIAVKMIAGEKYDEIKQKQKRYYQHDSKYARKHFIRKETTASNVIAAVSIVLTSCYLIVTIVAAICSITLDSIVHLIAWMIPALNVYYLILLYHQIKTKTNEMYDFVVWQNKDDTIDVIKIQTSEVWHIEAKSYKCSFTNSTILLRYDELELAIPRAFEEDFETDLKILLCCEE